MLLAAFLDRYPEFDQDGAAELVEKALAEQAGNLSVADFGDRYDEAHGLLTADALWSSPFGVTLRSDVTASDAESPYIRAYKRIAWRVQAATVGVSAPSRGW